MIITIVIIICNNYVYDVTEMYGARAILYSWKISRGIKLGGLAVYITTAN